MTKYLTFLLLEFHRREEFDVKRKFFEKFFEFFLQIWWNIYVILKIQEVLQESNKINKEIYGWPHHSQTDELRN
jgi:hypothetical protein